MSPKCQRCEHRAPQFARLKGWGKVDNQWFCPDHVKQARNKQRFESLVKVHFQYLVKYGEGWFAGQSQEVLAGIRSEHQLAVELLMDEINSKTLETSSIVLLQSKLIPSLQQIIVEPNFLDHEHDRVFKESVSNLLDRIRVNGYLPDHLRFKPQCLNCGKPMNEIESLGLALEGGGARCQQCGEDYNYQIYEGKMTLKRVSVPKGYTGPVERIFNPET